MDEFELARNLRTNIDIVFRLERAKCGDGALNITACGGGGAIGYTLATKEEARKGPPEQERDKAKPAPAHRCGKAAPFFAKARRKSRPVHRIFCRLTLIAHAFEASSARLFALYNGETCPLRRKIRRIAQR